VALAGGKERNPRPGTQVLPPGTRWQYATRHPVLLDDIVVSRSAVLLHRKSRKLGGTGARWQGMADTERRRARKGRNAAATEKTIASLRRGGRIEGVDAAALALARHLALGLDTVDPARYPAQTASLARIHLATLKSLRGIDDNDAAHDAGIDELLAALSTEVGDPAQP
jgi:hypothetical protein